eukprot:1150870-Pelagomonas_calceolata.AAC.15
MPPLAAAVPLPLTLSLVLLPAPADSALVLLCSPCPSLWTLLPTPPTYAPGEVVAMPPWLLFGLLPCGCDVTPGAATAAARAGGYGSGSWRSAMLCSVSTFVMPSPPAPPPLPPPLSPLPCRLLAFLEPSSPCVGHGPCAACAVPDAPAAAPSPAACDHACASAPSCSIQSPRARQLTAAPPRHLPPPALLQRAPPLLVLHEAPDPAHAAAADADALPFDIVACAPCTR